MVPTVTKSGWREGKTSRDRQAKEERMTAWKGLSWWMVDGFWQGKQERMGRTGVQRRSGHQAAGARRE